MSEDEGIKIGSRTIVAATARPSRITALLWGSAGTGKTTLAATAPGKKLIINFDPDGYTSVAGMPDVFVMDMTNTNAADINKFKNTNVLDLEGIIDEFDTIIVDSLTNVAYKALQQGIVLSKGATVERPDPQAYQVRNSLVTQLVKNMLALTSKHNKHLIFIAHEDAPVLNDEGSIVHITLSLGGKLPEQTALDFSEVWCVQDVGMGRNRRILFRPARNRKPMKTRMFETTGSPEFEWVYDADEHEGMTIAGWYEQWLKNNYKKIPVPSAPKEKK